VWCVRQVNVLLIAFFNWYYTFLQLEPKDLAEQLKRQVRAAWKETTPALLAPHLLCFR